MSPKTAPATMTPATSRPERGTHAQGMRAVALLEASKAIIVMIAGFGLLWTTHTGAAQLLEELASHMHLNPAKGTPRVFIDLAQDASSSHLWLLSAGAFGYALMQGVEAFGLWRQRRWAAWFSVASGGIYVPFELVELSRGLSAVSLGMLLVNLAIVAYMLCSLRAANRSRG